MSDTLPIYQVIPELTSHIAQSRNVILQAAPGAGKSTVVPLELLQHLGPNAGKILMLEPRRVAAKSIANYLATQLGERVGQTVGYRVRNETKVSASTRLEIITEGVLTRMIQRDPELDQVDIVIFDEFHERNLHGDLGLAFCLEVITSLRSDLRLVVMSATLDSEGLLKVLPDAELVFSSGRHFPVDTVYLGTTNNDDISQVATQTTLGALQSHEGSILVFLPGARWINRTVQQLQTQVGPDVLVLPLYGALSSRAQEQALNEPAQGQRHVIVATNIAETSLTIPNVQVVIDSGREQSSVFYPASGFAQLSLQMISQASAEQRKGRAGRVVAGTCYRMWSQESQHRLTKDIVPQILNEDVTSVVVEALNWGSQLADLPLLTQPSAAQVNYAHELLQGLTIIDENCRMTALGRAICSAGIEPRFAHWLHSLASEQEQVYGCLLIALLEDLRSLPSAWSLEALCMNLQSHHLKSVHRRGNYLWQSMGLTGSPNWPTVIDVTLATRLLCLLYPERIAKRRRDNLYTLANGKGASLMHDHLGPEWLLVLDGQQKQGQIQIYLAASLDESELPQTPNYQLSTADKVQFNKAMMRMEARQSTQYGAIVIASEPVAHVSQKTYQQAWRDYLSAQAINSLPFDDTSMQWWYRMQLAAKYQLPIEMSFDDSDCWPALTSLEQSARELGISDWFEHASLGRCKQYKEVFSLPWHNMLHQQLSWPLQQTLDNNLPISMTLPSGRNHKLSYTSDGQVKLSVKLQDMLGFGEVITLAQGRVVVTVELLSPASRPIQTTKDLHSFWTGSYKEVQKEMKGRYPKHRWPDNPLEAQAGKSIKR